MKSVLYRLNVGDIIKLRDDSLYVVVSSAEEGLIGINYTKSNLHLFTSYNMDFTHKKYSLLDIVAIYQSSQPYKPLEVLQLVEHIVYGKIADPHKIDSLIDLLGGWDWMSESIVPEPPLELTLREIEERLGQPIKLVESH